jgi:hypothetical protein
MGMCMSSNINNISNINEHVTDVQANPKTNDFKSMNSSDFTQNYGNSTSTSLPIVIPTSKKIVSIKTPILYKIVNQNISAKRFVN